MRVTHPRSTIVATLVVMLSCAVFATAAGASTPSVNYGPISHSGLKSAGPAPTGLKLTLQIGLIANNSGIQSAVKSASDPASSTYGKYLSLSTLASKYGASSSKINAVEGPFKSGGSPVSTDVTHLRTTATVSIGRAKELFGTSWTLYQTGTPNQLVALPTNTPKLPSGLSGNVDTVAGMRLNVTQSTARAYSGGTPTQTGADNPGCLSSTDPASLTYGQGLFPNQILTAYGISPLQAQGLLGQGIRLAIVGEGPTPINDLNAYRQCFGIPGSPLSIHGSTSLAPILESSLDAQTVAMVAPQLAAFDLWVAPISEEDDDGDVEGFLQLLSQPVQAAAKGASLPDVISVSYGECESIVKPYSASRTLVERQLAAQAAIGITTVVASGDSGSSACARGVPTAQLTSADKQPQTSWPATSPWVLAVGGTNLTLDATNAIASTGPWNDTAYPAPYTQSAGGGGGLSVINSRPWWQPAQPFNSSKRMVPDPAAFADPSPGYPIICSTAVQGCGAAVRNGQSVSFVGGTSAATPLVGGMVALWKQQARQQGLPNPGFVAPLLYTMAARSPQAFIDITQGSNALFGGPCCTASPGYDLTTGIGSPLANQVAGLLAARG